MGVNKESFMDDLRKRFDEVIFNSMNYAVAIFPQEFSENLKFIRDDFDTNTLDYLKEFILK